MSVRELDQMHGAVGCFVSFLRKRRAKQLKRMGQNNIFQDRMVLNQQQRKPSTK